MNIEVINLDGTSTTYGYAPEYREAVKHFYQNLFEKGLITGWAIR